MKKILLTVLTFLFTAALGHTQNCDNLIQEPLNSKIVLVIDKSGSMGTESFKAAKEAVISFINSMDSNDEAAVIAFSDDVGIVQSFTSDKQKLRSAVYRLQVGGQTRLYDAVARAGQMLIRKPGLKVIVYLTDGVDNKSAFTLRDVREMNIGEGIYVYGIGLGNVDHDSLRTLSSATWGKYASTGDPSRLAEIYADALHRHYDATGGLFAETGGITVTSIPSGAAVLIDGEEIGTTPLKKEGFEEGTHEVKVIFGNGIWECSAPVKAGYRNRISARETDLPAVLWIESAPHNAAVYLDGSYIGTTAMVPSIKRGSTTDYSNQLKVESVPPGKHRLKLIAVPDFDFSPSQVFDFEFTMGDGSRYVNVFILMQQARFDDGETIKGRGLPDMDGGIDVGGIKDMIPSF